MDRKRRSEGKNRVMKKKTCAGKKARSPKPKTPLVKIMDRERDTLYPWAGLPIKPVLVGTHVDVRLEIEEPLHSFRARRRLRPRSCLSGKTLVFHLRHAFQVLQIRSQCQNPGNYRAFNLILSSIMTYSSPKADQT